MNTNEFVTPIIDEADKHKQLIEYRQHKKDKGIVFTSVDLRTSSIKNYTLQDIESVLRSLSWVDVIKMKLKFNHSISDIIKMKFKKKKDK
jgi:hypothetical protein